MQLSYPATVAGFGARVKRGAASLSDNQTSSGPSSPVGRTQWDALVDIVRLLGNGAPYVILVGLGIFGVWKFQELNQQKDKDLDEARQKATQSYREQLSEANERLIKTYESMGSISETQIKNLSQTLSIQQVATERAKALQNDLEKLTSEANQHRSDSEAAKLAAETARAERERLKKELERLQIDGDLLQTEVQKKRKEFQDLEQNVRERQRSQKQVAEQISEVRKKMYELAHAVRNRSEASEGLAEAILKDAELNVSEGESIFTSMKDFIGRSESDLTRAVEIDDNVRFAARLTHEKQATTLFLIAQSLDDGKTFRNVVSFEADSARIVNATKCEFMAAALLPRADDWFATQPKFFMLSDSRIESNNFLLKNGTLDEWTVAQIDIDGANPAMQPIKGGGIKAKYLNVKEFHTLLQNKVIAGLEFEDGYLAFKRSLEFSAAKVFPQTVSGVPSDLRETVIHFLDALVKRQKDDAERASAAPLVPILGQIAAVALRPNFQFVAVNSAVASAGTKQGTPNSVTLIANYDRLSSKKETASFRFFNTDGAGWKLDQFIPAAQVVAN